MTDPFLAALADSSGRVSRQAMEALYPRRWQLPAARLSPLLAEDTPAHIRRNAFRLLALGPTWPAFGWITRMLRDSDPRMAALAGSLLKPWSSGLKGNAIQPSEEQKSAARAAMNEAEEHIPPSLKEWLRFVFR